MKAFGTTYEIEPVTPIDSFQNLKFRFYLGDLRKVDASGAAALARSTVLRSVAPDRESLSMRVYCSIEPTSFPVNGFPSEREL